MMRAAKRIDTGRDDADALAFQYGKGHSAKIEHDMVCVIVAPHRGDPGVADNRGPDRRFGCARPVEIGIRMRRRPRRHHRGNRACIEAGLLALLYCEGIGDEPCVRNVGAPCRRRRQVITRYAGRFEFLCR